MITLNASEMKELLETRIPEILQESPGFREWLREFIRRQTVSRETFDERFDRIMNELAADRETQRLKWEEQDRRWDEQNRKWDEQNRKWDETLKEIRSIKSKSEQSIGALGARWGVASEEAFRAALRSILKDSFGVEVFSVNEFDDEGMVFGRPDQVELDIIIANGTLILCELKSSISRGEIYLFERKVRFYEQHHQRIAKRRIVISPMVDARAREIAKTLNIEVFSYAEDAVRHEA